MYQMINAVDENGTNSGLFPGLVKAMHPDQIILPQNLTELLKNIIKVLGYIDNITKNDKSQPHCNSCPW